MEKQQLELLIKENSELKEQKELLKKEILILKNQIKTSVNKTEIDKVIDEDYSENICMNLWLETIIYEVDDDGIKLSVSSNMNTIDYSETFSISNKEISEWLNKKDTHLTKENLNVCIEELSEKKIENLLY
jgi:hypothetical protein